MAWALFGREWVSRFSHNVVRGEVGAARHHVTIVEPGGFRTDFAGSSTKLKSKEIPTNRLDCLSQPAKFSAATQR